MLEEKPDAIELVRLEEIAEVTEFLTLEETAGLTELPTLVEIAGVAELMLEGTDAVALDEDDSGETTELEKLDDDDAELMLVLDDKLDEETADEPAGMCV